jgi:predicted RNA binding protein YcfA (HicA-like mRNA interferase family)
MKALTGRELCKLLEREGWSLLRISGSHYIYGKSGLRVRLSVPIHGSQALKMSLLRHLLKQAGISEDDR